MTDVAAADMITRVPAADPGGQRPGITGDSGPVAGAQEPALADVIGTCGGHWQIERIDSPMGCIGLRRPGPAAQRIVAGHDLHDLACKLKAAT